MNKFKEKFDVDNLLIYKTKYWTWSLRPEQVTIGSGILSLNRDCNKLSDVLEEEFANLKEIVEIIETSLMKSFNYEKINYLMLMMVDKQIHYHVIPRYSKNIFYENKEWKDFGWPKLPLLDKSNKNVDLNKKIVEKIKHNITI